MLTHGAMDTFPATLLVTKTFQTHTQTSTQVCCLDKKRDDMPQQWEIEKTDHQWPITWYMAVLFIKFYEYIE